MKMNTEKLIKNIIDQIKEAQIKLGFAKETTRLYYPVESLNAMLGIHAKNDKEMLELLASSDIHNTGLGTLLFQRIKDVLKSAYRRRAPSMSMNMWKNQLF